MNILAFIAFLLALILLVVSIKLGWVIWLAVIGGLLLATGAGPSWTPHWMR